jgi:hypothetical protein
MKQVTIDNQFDYFHRKMDRLKIQIMKLIAIIIILLVALLSKVIAQDKDCRTSVTYIGWTGGAYTILIVNKMPVATYYHIIYPNGVNMYTNNKLNPGGNYFTYNGGFVAGRISVIPTENIAMPCLLNWVSTEYFNTYYPVGVKPE